MEPTSMKHATDDEEYVVVRCSDCGFTADAVPMSVAASDRPIYCDACDRHHDGPLG